MNEGRIVIAPRERMLRMKALREKLGGAGESTIYRLMACEKFPRPLVLRGVSIWPESLVNEYLASLPRAKSKARAKSTRASLAPGVRAKSKKRKARAVR